MSEMAVNGIPNRIMDQLPAMSAAEAICTLILARATYGRGQNWARLTYSDFQHQSMYKGDATIAKALKAVLRRGLFRRLANCSVWVIEGPAMTIEQPCCAQNEPSREPTADGRLGLAAEQTPACAGPAAAAKNEALAEEGASLSEKGSSLAEERPSLAEECPSLAEERPSLFEERPSLFEESGRGGSAVGPKIEAVKAGNGPEIEPLPFNKEKDLLTPYRERRRKKKRAREGRPGAGYQGPYHPAIPSPVTPEETELAEHSATAIWLEAGFSWPGWERLRVVTRRMGPEPQPDRLRQAREMWLMAGYRSGNIGGVLDWYEQLCRDPTWQPFRRTSGYGSTAPTNGPGPVDPTMAMLLQMQEEMINGKRGSDNAMFDSAQVSLSPDGVRPPISGHLPAGPGGY